MYCYNGVIGVGVVGEGGIMYHFFLFYMKGGEEIGEENNDLFYRYEIDGKNLSGEKKKIEKLL